MTYTVWSRGRMLGETELAYRRAMPCLRAGDFAPSEIGEKLMSIIVGVAPALNALYDLESKTRREQDAAIWKESEDGFPQAIRHSTEFADAASIADELESLALELRDASGAVVETEHIWFNDTHRLLAIARDEIRNEEPDSAFDDADPLEPQFPRYQIFVGLPGNSESMRDGMKLDPEFEAELKARMGEEFEGLFDDEFFHDLDEELNDD